MSNDDLKARIKCDELKQNDRSQSNAYKFVERSVLVLGAVASASIVVIAVVMKCVFKCFRINLILYGS